MLHVHYFESNLIFLQVITDKIHVNSKTALHMLPYVSNEC